MAFAFYMPRFKPNSKWVVSRVADVDVTKVYKLFVFICLRKFIGKVEGSKAFLANVKIAY